MAGGARPTLRPARRADSHPRHDPGRAGHRSGPRVRLDSPSVVIPAAASAGLAIAAAGASTPAIIGGASALVVGITIAAAGIGAVFVAASATALSTVPHHEAGIAAGILSTFHELGAAFGVAVTSSLAAASIAGTTASGFTRGFTFAAIVAAAAGLISQIVVPRTSAPDQPSVVVSDGELARVSA